MEYEPGEWVGRPEAHAQMKRRLNREKSFRAHLADLLTGEAYAGVDATAKERLLDDVTALAFPPRGIEP